MGLFRKLLLLNKYFRNFDKFPICVLLFSMIFLSFGQVISRNFFSKGFIWIDIVLRIEVLWLTFIGAALATEYRQHIKIDFLSNITSSDRLKKQINIIAQIFSMFICLFLFIISAHYIQVISIKSSSTLFNGIPDWAFKIVIPYSFFMIFFRSLINIPRIYFEEDWVRKGLG